MVDVRYGMLDDRAFENYLKFLIGQLYKILPIYEQRPETIKSYLESLQIELVGNSELIATIRYDGDFLRLLGTIQYLISHETTHKTIKREVFKLISIIEKLQSKYGKDGDGIE